MEDAQKLVNKYSDSRISKFNRYRRWTHKEPMAIDFPRGAKWILIQGMYDEFDSVLLKDGRFASLDDKDGPGSYTGTVGDGPKDWEVVYLTDADIERRLTEKEKKEWAARSEKQLKELGL